MSTLLASVLLAAILAALTVAAVTYLIFLCAACGSSPSAPRAPGSSPALALIFRSALGSTAGVLLAMSLFPFAPLARRRCTQLAPRPLRPGPAQGDSASAADGQPRPGRPPVILIHGLYHNVTAWTLYRRWLAAAGFTRVHCHAYSSWNTDFERLVTGLDATVRALRAAHPNEKPILMGHSLGGLVIRGWLANADHQDMVAGAVTLGTPHQGSRLAVLGAGRLARSLRFRGELIRTLETREAPARIPCVALYSTMDNMVIPQQGLHVTTPGWELRPSPAVCHIGMLWSRKTADMAVDAMRGMSPSRR